LTHALAEPSRVPRYERLEQALAATIVSGVLPVGTLLPPEGPLAARIGVSRQTLNQALGGLARRGLVVRRRGIGTFVAEPFIEQPLGALYSFIRTLTAQGRAPSSRLLGQRLTHADGASRTLTGSVDGLVFEISRLRLVDGEPLVVEHVWLPPACGERIPLERLTRDVLYDVLRDVCGIEVSHAEETLQPTSLAHAEAALLGVAPGAAAFLVERIGYAGSAAVEVRRSVIRGDRYRFRAHLAGPLADQEDLAANVLK
jgi:GntR family transcriptional regulator